MENLRIEEFDACPVKLITPRRHDDDRGFFSESYSKKALAEAGIIIEFVQDNHSLSKIKGTVRGLHFQTPPFAQDKLVRVTNGSVFDVAVDLRQGSSTFGKHVSAILSAKSWTQILIPIGFAHGFMTLEPNTEVLYKVSAPYSKEHDKGILWNDPQLRIPWPLNSATLSSKDSVLPALSQIRSPF